MPDFVLILVGVIGTSVSCVLMDETPFKTRYRILAILFAMLVAYPVLLMASIEPEISSVKYLDVISVKTDDGMTVQYMSENGELKTMHGFTDAKRVKVTRYKCFYCGVWITAFNIKVKIQPEF